MKKGFMKGGYSLDSATGVITVGGSVILLLVILDTFGVTNIFGKSGGQGKRL
jgi:hypothetical protein